ncbi:hypothetical protein ASF91_15210 [Rhizobium sp. Leaf155]|nr:hypothetical protein ASF91_15210 [Rhizobium sp. Leaf155]
MISDEKVELGCKAICDRHGHVWPDDFLEEDRKNARANIRAALEAASANGEPAAYMHTLHMEFDQKERRVNFRPLDPFGQRGHDYSPEYHVTTEPLFKADDLASGDNGALQAAYAAGFQAAAQGYNGEIYPEFETDDEWLAKRDAGIARIQNVGRMSDGRKDVGKKSDEIA